MTMKDLWERFVEQSPVTVMARVVLEQAISAEWINSVFEKHRQRQYTRELLFSTVVELMMMVVLGVRRSVHAAAKKAADLPVSLTALYTKLDKTEPGVMRALVQGSAERLAPVMTQVRATRAPLVPDDRIRIVDGNHLPASDKRLAVLRDWRGAALPGQSLVVFDPDQDLVVDLEPCDDGHMQERLLMRAIQDIARAGKIWMADRNFCTRPILGALAEHGASFLIREHEANAHPMPRGLFSRVGRVETGIVYEQPVELTLTTAVQRHVATARVLRDGGLAKDVERAGVQGPLDEDGPETYAGGNESSALRRWSCTCHARGSVSGPSHTPSLLQARRHCFSFSSIRDPRSVLPRWGLSDCSGILRWLVRIQNYLLKGEPLTTCADTISNRAMIFG